MNLTKPIVAVALAVALPVVAFAGTPDPRVDPRQANQQARIHQGAQSGELTRGEIRRLHTRQRAIRAEERACKSDGKLTRDERADLRHDLRAASRSIRVEKHDTQQRL